MLKRNNQLKINRTTNILIMATKKAKVEQEVSVEDKLKSLFKLQSYLSEIDRIKILRGEL